MTITSISIPNTELSNDDPSKPFTLYNIEITTESGANYSVSRRYSDFFALQKNIKRSFPGIKFSFPPKIITGSSIERNVIDRRKKELNEFLQTILFGDSPMASEIQKFEPLKEFLKPDIVISNPTEVQQKDRLTRTRSNRIIWKNLDSFKFEEKVGTGAFGEVWRASWEGIYFAIKTVSPKSPKEEQEAQNEISVLKKITHRNIISMFAYGSRGDELWLILEYCQFGTISKVIEKNGLLEEEQILYICKSILEALSYLHTTLFVIHRDIKPENFLLTSDHEVKLGDFGSCYEAGSASGGSDQVVGTPHWMAPEVWSGKFYSFSADIWSFGISLFFLMNGTPPFAQMTSEELQSFIQRCENIETPSPELWSENLIEFLGNCLNPNPKNRYDSDQLLLTGLMIEAPSKSVMKTLKT